jgi:UrcA family protein
MYRFTTTMMIFALAFGFQTAHAASPQDAPSVFVQFGDLDLSRTAGATILYQRLRGAAETVCASLDDRNLLRHMKFNACVQRAIGAAVAKVDRPALSAYYKAQTSDHNPTIQTAQNQAQ